MSTHEGLSLTESTTAISEGAQAIDGHRARSRDLTKHEVPQPVEVDRDLLTIGLTELIEHKGLYSPLISADLEDMRLDTELIQSLTVEGRSRSQPDKPHHTLRVEDDLVRYRREVISLLVIGVSVGDDELPRGAEVLECLTQVCRRSHAPTIALHIEVDTSYAGVRLRLTDAGEGLRERDRLLVRAHPRDEAREFVRGDDLRDRAKIDLQHAPIPDLSRSRA